MTCPEFRIKERLPDLLSGGLPPEEELRIRQHLALCPECREELELLGFFAADRGIDPPPGFRVVLPEKAAASRRLLPWRIRVPLAPAWVGGIAAAVLAFLLAGYWNSSPPRVDDHMLSGYMTQKEGSPILGLGEEILSISGLGEAEVDRFLDREIGLAGEADENVLPVGGLAHELLEGMDSPTIRIFEDLVDDMAPDGVKRG